MKKQNTWLAACKQTGITSTLIHHLNYKIQLHIKRLKIDQIQPKLYHDHQRWRVKKKKKRTSSSNFVHFSKWKSQLPSPTLWCVEKKSFVTMQMRRMAWDSLHNSLRVFPSQLPHPYKTKRHSTLHFTTQKKKQTSLSNMAKALLLSASLCLVLLFNGCLARSDRPQNQCQFDRLQAREPDNHVQSEGGIIESWNPQHKEFQCAGVALLRLTIQPNGLHLPSYTNAPQLIHIVRGIYIYKDTLKV